MRKILGCALFIALSLSTKAQIAVTLNHLGTTTLYKGVNAVVEANAAAVNGDTINIPGGYFTSITISKKLVIFGTGHFPDSLNATGRSYLTSGITLNDGADSSHIEGLYFDGDISFASGSDIDDVVIRRCNFGSLSIAGTAKNNERTLINQNIIRGSVDFNNTTHLLFCNNIVYDKINNNTESTNLIDHNAFLYTTGSYWSGAILNNVSNTLFTNNIFSISWPGEGGSSAFLSGNNNTFTKNIFIFNPTTTWWDNNYTGGNLYDVSTTTIFENRTHGSTFNYTQNFNLQATCAGKNAGTDGTDIGIFGGISVYTFKTASMPSNPHISAKTIDPTTSSNGKLGVNIKVNAQDR